jgi:hypothetical protein
MKRTKKLWWAGALSLVATIAQASNAFALPALGASADAFYEDTEGRSLHLKQFIGKPVLILYEDKGSANVNAALKAELARVAKGGRYDARVALVPVADVSAYDYWPVRGFARDAVRAQSRKVGVPIYCDWHGAFRQQLALRRGTSNVLLIGKTGHVLFASEGALLPGERETLLRLVHEQLGE